MKEIGPKPRKLCLFYDLFGLDTLDGHAVEPQPELKGKNHNRTHRTAPVGDLRFNPWVRIIQTLYTGNEDSQPPLKFCFHKKNM